MNKLIMNMLVAMAVLGVFFSFSPKAHAQVEVPEQIQKEQGTPQMPEDLSAENMRETLVDPDRSGNSTEGPGAELPSSQDDLEDGSDQPVMLDVLDLKQMDILDVLKLIAQKSGLNIVASQEVQGRVTVFLKDVEVMEALRIIVSAYGWAFVQDGGILRVMTGRDYVQEYGHRFGRPMETRVRQVAVVKSSDAVSVLSQIKNAEGKVVADQNSGTLILMDEPRKLDEMEDVIRQMDTPVQTKMFHLNTAKAEDLSAKIGECLTPSLGTMNVDSRSNRILVSDTEPKIQKIEELIMAFDQKDREVLIEAKILQIVLSDEHKLGIDWQALVTDYHGLAMTGDFDILGEAEKRGAIGIGTVAADGYTVLIEALQTVGHADILSSPRITAVNNHEAKILVGSTEPYVTTTTTTPSSGPTTIAESVNFIEVGVKLFVTPTIHKDNFITMKIKPEVSSVTRSVTTGNNNTIPVVETSEAETTVMVKDQVTLVIGGLIKEEKIQAVKKVPLLGSLPVFGAAFRNTNDLSRKTEIVILLTPRIVTGDQ